MRAKTKNNHFHPVRHSETWPLMVSVVFPPLVLL